MAYIGPAPNPGQNREVDDISSGFNGSEVNFTLQVNSQNVSPGSPNAIVVSLGGVVQNPGTDYTIAASTITFTTAPANGLSFFGLVLGQQVDTQSLADGASPTMSAPSITGDLSIADKIVHTGDTNTAIRFPAGDTVTAETGGSERVRVDSSGRVGIGTSSPSNIIHATGSNSSTGYQFINTHATDGFGVRIVGGGTTADRYALRVDDAAENERFRINANGDVGIGETTPLAQLHIKPATNKSQLLLEQNNATDGYALFQDGPNGGHLKFMRHINGSETQKLLLRSSGGLCFGTDNAEANALDDYEEGLWTPAISGVTYTDTQGHYVKIGTTCFVTLTLNGANTSKGGDVRITGLPFTPKVDGGEFYPANSIPFFEVSSISLASGYQNLYARIDDGAGNIQLLVSDGESHNTLAGGGGTTLNSGHVLRTSFTYLTGS